MPEAPLFSYHTMERLAAGFVLEDETWPAFLAWVRENGLDGNAAYFADNVSLHDMRTQYIAHSSPRELDAMLEARRNQ